MTLPMIIALAVTVLMIILIMVDKLPFGAPPLLALLLLVVFGVTDIKTAFGGFANPTIVMLASFMAIIAALQKTSFIVKFKQTMFNMASKGGFKAYVLLILIVMLGCSLFGTGSTAYYVLDVVRSMGFRTEMVPGVPSFCAVAARLGVSLTGMDTALHIAPGSASLKDTLSLPGTRVLMKSGRQMPTVLAALAERGALDKSMMVRNCGLPGEAVYPDLSRETPPENLGYFSTVIVKE